LIVHLCECLEGSDELGVFDLDVRQLSHTIFPIHHHSAVPGSLLVATMLLGNKEESVARPEQMNFVCCMLLLGPLVLVLPRRMVVMKSRVVFD